MQRKPSGTPAYIVHTFPLRKLYVHMPRCSRAFVNTGRAQQELLCSTTERQ